MYKNCVKTLNVYLKFIDYEVYYLLVTNKCLKLWKTSGNFFLVMESLFVLMQDTDYELDRQVVLGVERFVTIPNKIKKQFGPRTKI